MVATADENAASAAAHASDRVGLRTSPMGMATREEAFATASSAIFKLQNKVDARRLSHVARRIVI
jgi:hypothetical protein